MSVAPGPGGPAGNSVDEAIADRIRSHVRDIPDYPTPGVLFKDITPLLASGPVFGDVVQAMAAPHVPGTGLEVDLVAGIEARGFILAAPVAVALGVGFVPVRKQGKLPHETVGAEYVLEYGTATIEIHADCVSPGAKVLIIDDVLATGGTAAAACALFEQIGATVAGVSVLLEVADLHGRDRLADRPLRTLIVS